jgi:large subunit ribosomal protein L10
MALSQQEKHSIVGRLSDEFKSATSVAFADFRGLTVAQADELRKKARESGIRYIVTKKSLFNIAAKAAGYDLDAKKFEGMIGAAFGHGDEVAPAKLLGDMGKKAPVKIMGGIFEGKVVPQEQMIALSKLPGKKELLGTVVGTIYAPVSAFVRALNAIRESREGAGGASASVAATVESAPEAPAEPESAPAAA